MRKTTFWFPTWSDTNQAEELQKLARGLEFQILENRGIVLSTLGQTYKCAVLLIPMSPELSKHDP